MNCQVPGLRQAGFLVYRMVCGLNEIFCYHIHVLQLSLDDPAMYLRSDHHSALHLMMRSDFFLSGFGLIIKAQLSMWDVIIRKPLSQTAAHEIATEVNDHKLTHNILSGRLQADSASEMRSKPAALGPRADSLLHLYDTVTGSGSSSKRFCGFIFNSLFSFHWEVCSSACSASAINVAILLVSYHKKSCHLAFVLY